MYQAIQHIMLESRGKNQNENQEEAKKYENARRNSQLRPYKLEKDEDPGERPVKRKSIIKVNEI